MNLDLFDEFDPNPSLAPVVSPIALGQQAFLLRQFAGLNQLDVLQALLQDIDAVAAVAPFRHMQTARGHSLSAAMSNCGARGWVSNQHGYRYTTHDPLTGLLWPPMPRLWFELAQQAAAQAGFDNFQPDACLINQYVAGSRMGLHQDKDEAELKAPVLSVSLGDTAVFRIGAAGGGPTRTVKLASGDV
ncbi:MAG: alpha-ketoglutarate-dependent dioxygenase AlkB, partial [Moraxellaceae bacterium]